MSKTCDKTKSRRNSLSVKIVSRVFLMALKILNVIVYFLVALCSFVTFLSRTECQASRISLCRHADDLSTISTLSKSIWWLWSKWCLANKEFSSNVAMAFVCSFTRVFSTRDVSEHNHSLYILSCTRFLRKPLSRSCH